METRFISLLSAVCLSFMMLTLASCGNNEKIYKREIYALDTVIDFKVYGDETAAKKAVDAAAAEIERLENEMSINGSGDISKINSLGYEGVRVNDETFDLLRSSLEISKETEGAFDISVYPLMHLYGFDTEQYYVPSDDEIIETLKLVDYKNITLEKDNTVVLKEGMKIDLGGIAKGYITEKAAEKLIENNIESAVINSGGNVYALGMKPGGKMYTVGIQDPDDGSAYFSKLEISDKFAVTSGTYQRHFEKNGKIYHHIMDTKTGRPVENDIRSVTIIGNEGALCDAYSTSLFSMGIDKSIDFYRESRDFDFIILTDENNVYISSGIKDSFKLAEGYDMSVNVID